MAIDIDKTTDAIGIPVDGLGRHYVLKNKIDFSVDNLGSGEKMGVLDIPANTQVREVWVKVITGETGATGIDIGIDGGYDNGFHDNSSFETTGWVRDITGQEYSPPKGFISTSNAIVAVKAGTGGISKAVVEFYAECLDLNFDRVK